MRNLLLRLFLTSEERETFEVILAARKVQESLWGEQNKNWGLEEYRRMFEKRWQKIEAISPKNPYGIIELRKRLLQNAAIAIALMTTLKKKPLVKGISNLAEYKEEK
jgi:hypothetical protein